MHHFGYTMRIMSYGPKPHISINKLLQKPFLPLYGPILTHFLSAQKNIDIIVSIAKQQWRFFILRHSKNLLSRLC